VSQRTICRLISRNCDRITCPNT